MANYKLGTDDPTIKPDVGAGNWNSKPPSQDVMVKAEVFRDALGSNSTNFGILGIPPVILRSIIIARIGNDAVKHLDHYFQNTGKDYTIDLVGMVGEVASAKDIYKKEISNAIDFVKGLKPGTHQITSGKATGGYNLQDKSKNWFFAVGGYSVWGKGKAIVTDKGGGKREYFLVFEYKFFDRYNWDTGKQVTIPIPGKSLTVTDHFMGEFHRSGLAKEFNMYGSFSSQITWGSDMSPRIIDPFIATNVRTTL